ncbi:MAG: hypothetical protein AAGC81_08930 [Pseudomonadota bacterium]
MNACRVPQCSHVQWTIGPQRGQTGVLPQLFRDVGAWGWNLPLHITVDAFPQLWQVAFVISSFLWSGLRVIAEIVPY